MAGGAPKGNNNAEKWTHKEINEFIENVYDYVIKNKGCCSLGEAVTECGQYESLLRYFKEKNLKNVDFAPIKRVKDIIKQRIIKKGLESEYNATMSIFVLKANHGMKDNPDEDSKKDKYDFTFNFILDSEKHKAE